jgi:hypothetical protein
MGLTIGTCSTESKRPLKGKRYEFFTRQDVESQMDEEGCTLPHAAEWTAGARPPFCVRIEQYGTSCSAADACHDSTYSTEIKHTIFT